MMIIELFLIRQLLKKSIPLATVQYDPDYDYRLKVPKPIKVGYSGEGKRFRPPISIPELKPQDVAQWWVDATKDIPITSLPPRAR